MRQAKQNGRTPGSGPIPKAKEPSQDRGQRRVQRLLDAAVDVVLEYGPEGLKMDMVAKRAATSPGSLYQFFPNRLALLGGLMDHYGRALMALADAGLAREHMSPSANLVEAGRVFLAPFLRFYADNPAYVVLAEAADRVFADEDRRFPEDDAVARILVEILIRFQPNLAKRRANQIARLLVVACHAAMAEAATLAPSQRKEWLGELDALICGYLSTLAEN